LQIGAREAGRKLDEMQDDLAFKSKNLEASKSTQQRLQQELAKRNSELEKINTLDGKISVELKSLKEKIDSMQRDLGVYQDTDTLRAEAAKTCQQLRSLKQKYAKRRDAVKAQVAPLSHTYDKLKNALVEDDTAKELEQLEQKLRHYEQSIFHLSEFIETKSRETDFQSQKEHCGRIIDELNGLLIGKAQQAQQFNPASGGFMGM